MPTYYTLGIIPPKRHTQFRKPDGGLYHEEVFGTEGFSGVYSILYHRNPPTGVTRMEKLAELSVDPWDLSEHRHHHIKTKDLEEGKDPIESRKLLLYNGDVSISLCRPRESMNYFFRNAEADELYFVHEGKGELHSIFGVIPFDKGDYLLVPRGTTYRLVLNGSPCRLMVIESPGAIETPKRYRNEYGQLLEHSPFCERDIKRPSRLETFTETGDFEVRVKIGRSLMTYHFGHHPLDVVGWDGYLYPWTLNIADFEPITGRIHQPPPVHQTFEAQGLMVLSFVPRKLDYHPLAVPVPYYHSNIDSDEMLYYVSSQFMSRRGIELGSITVHRRGIHHGPQPGVVESSLGKESTNEYAIMVEAYKPLSLTKIAQRYDDPSYPFSWTEAGKS